MLDIQHLSFAVTNEAAGKEILHDITLTVDSGRFVVITGAERRWKIDAGEDDCRLEKPTAGKILLDGTDMTDLSITDRAKLGVSYAFHQPCASRASPCWICCGLRRQAPVGQRSVRDFVRSGLCARDYVNREVNGSLVRRRTQAH